MYDISVIIPAFNEQQLLPRCVNSVRESLNSSIYVHKYEIIIVDNNSTDDTFKVAEQLNCTVIKCMKKGVTRARQAGLEASKYEFQIYLDADNFVPKNYVDFIVNLDKPDVVAISGPINYYDGGFMVNIFAKIFYRFSMIFHHIVGPSMQGGNIMLKRSKMIQIGMPVDIDFFSEDSFWAKRLSKLGKIKLVPKTFFVDGDGGLWK